VLIRPQSQALIPVPVPDLDINTITNVTEALDIRTLQRQCPDFTPIFHYMETGQLPADDSLARKIILQSEQYVIDDRILYHLFSPRTSRLEQFLPMVYINK